MVVLRKTAQTKALTNHFGARFAGVKVPSFSGCRLQSTCTLTTLPQSPRKAPQQALQTTPSLTDAKDFSTQVQSDYGQEVLNQAVLSAFHPQRIACELDIVEAAANKHNFDKILLLVNHGEAAVKKNDHLGIPLLTGRGVGQALTLSRQTCLFCDNDLSPELVVLAPLGCSIQTTLHAFPYNAPDSVRGVSGGVSWICHGDLVPKEESAISQSFITKNFPGMDLSQYDSGGSENFLEWIKRRDERVIVGKSCCCILCRLARRSPVMNLEACMVF
jgi:hypothetical protein